jgi:hypothetical protein
VSGRVSRELEVSVTAAETDAAALGALDAITAEFPGPDRIVVAVELSDGATRRVTLHRAVDATNPLLAATIDRVLVAHSHAHRPPT